MTKSKQGIYETYTSTHALADNLELEDVLAWSHGYFTANYSTLLPESKDARILDIGCGYGRHLLSLAKMGYHNCQGIDISGEQIETARSLGLSNVEQADALEWLSDKESEYDCILALDILEHLKIEDLLLLGEKVAKALRPGGIFIVQAPNAMSVMNPFIYGDLTHERAFTVESIRQFFRLVGLTPTILRESPNYVHGLPGAIRAVIWRFILRPMVLCFARIAYGRISTGVYTANLIAVGVKS